MKKTIHFSDPGLEWAARNSTLAKPEGNIYYEELGGVKFLLLPENTVDISQIVYFPNLERISVTSSDISLDILTELPRLKALSIDNPSDSQIESLKKLERLEGLTLLPFNRNEFRNFTALGEIKNLKRLEIIVATACVVNIEAIGCCHNLEHLNLMAMIHNDQYKSLASLHSLRSLDMSYIKNEAFPSLCNILSELPKLEKIKFTDPTIVDISSIGYLRSLKALSLNTVNLHDISPVARLSKLEMLTLQDMSLRDLRCLNDIKNLKLIRLVDTEVEDMDSFRSREMIQIMDKDTYHELSYRNKNE